MSDAGHGAGGTPEEAGELDPFDRRVIAVLQRHPRAPASAIGATMGMSEQEVDDRIASLTASGVIEVVAMTDPIQLGYARMAMIGVVLEGPVAPVVDTLVEDPQVIYLVRTQGEFDLLAEVVGASDAALLELVARMRRLPGVARIHTFLENRLVKEDYTYGGLAPGP